MSTENRIKAPSRISLRIVLKNEKEASDIAEALKVDDDDFVTTKLEGSTVIGEVEADSVEGARRAADDWLACLMAIVKKE